jgi:hypothetical protein
VDDSQSTLSMNTGDDWRFPLSTPVYLRSDVDSIYQSRLHSAEFNLRFNSSFGRLTWLAGFRWIGLDEQLDMRAGPLYGRYPAYFIFRTNNNLFGGQVGADVAVLDRGPFHVGCTLKAGLYGNAARNAFDYDDSNGTSTLLSSDRQDQVAFAGDINVTGVYQCTKHLALQGGYQLLWIQDVAIAGDQLAAVNSDAGNGITSNGRVFYHGALASINFTW